MKKIIACMLLAMSLVAMPSASFARAGSAPVASAGEVVPTDQMNALTVRYVCARDYFDANPNPTARGAVVTYYANAQAAKTAGNLTVFNQNVTAFNNVVTTAGAPC